MSKRIWIKRGKLNGKQWIDGVEAFEIKSSMELDGNVVPVSPRFVVRHTSGGFSVTPVPNLLDLQWGIENAVQGQDGRLQSAD